MMRPPTPVSTRQRTRVKLCGLTREQDVDAALAAGVDALGFICYPPSPRHIELKRFKALSERAGPFVTVVAVVVDPDTDYLRKLVDHVGFDVVQFHGRETPNFCRQWSKPWIKATRVQDGMDINATLAKVYPDARGWLVDAYHKDKVGGTGDTFNWNLLRGVDRERLVLAGGLDVHNISQAIAQVQPFALDISSGAEDQPGVKNADKLTAIMAAVRAADSAIDSPAASAQ